ncbi:hypothetical protein Leryth_020863 [Lithospermum erythrorhizon]|nr:hypothetical protein Leryth_020863 [Lithospermum erythrorhizon]
MQMHKVLLPFFLTLCVTPSTHSLEGTLMAGRDLKFISLSMTGIFCLGSLLLLMLTSRGCGLVGCWFTLVVYQWVKTRFLELVHGAYTISITGMLYSEDLTSYQPSKACTG